MLCFSNFLSPSAQWQEPQRMGKRMGKRMVMKETAWAAGSHSGQTVVQKNGDGGELRMGGVQGMVPDI